MISDPSLVHYACIAEGTTILAEFISKDAAALGATAAKCLEKTPPFHAFFNHTVRSSTYTFFVDEPFVYFLISDEKLEKSERIAFLKSVRDAFVKGGSKLSSHCFQGDFNPVFRRLLGYINDGIESTIGPRIGESGPMKSRLVEQVIGRRNVEKEIDGKVWKKKQVWLDLMAFAILFLVWLWLCKCMEARVD